MDDAQALPDVLCDTGLLRTLVNHSAEVITVMDVSGHYLYVSPSVEKSMGWTPTELVGRHALDIVHPDDKQQVSDVITALLQAPHSPQTLRFRFTRPDGGSRLLETTGRLWRQAGMQPLILAHSRDITEQENTGQALRDSEQRYRQLIENSPDAIFAHSQGVIIFANSAAAELFAAESPEDLIGRPAASIIHPDDLPGMRERIQTALSQGRDAPLREERMLRLNGEEIWVEAKGVFTEINGQPAIQAVTRDVTQRHIAMQAEARRAEATRMLYELASQAEVDIHEQLQQALALGASISGMESGFISECSATTCTITHCYGPAGQASQGQKLPLDTTYCDIPIAASGLVAITDIDNSPYADHSAVLRTPQKSYIGIPLELRGHTFGVLGFSSSLPRPHAFDDVDCDLVRLMARWVEFALERASAGAALETLNRDLLRSNEELQQFAYIASHDLKEPLRAVTTYLQLLDRRYGGQLNAEAHEFMDFAVTGATRMQNIIQDLLEFSRVGTHSDTATQVSLEKLLAQSLTEIKDDIAATGAHITHDELPAVIAHEGLLSQLLQNLIGNAIKYRRPGVAPKVHISAEALGSFWRINLRDNGIGVERQHRERIFQMFRRLHSHDEYEGTGIGLAIAKRIVERHGGEIGVEDASGDGSCFFFTLPTGTGPNP